MRLSVFLLRAIVCLAVLAAGGRAHAQPAQCSPALRAWVDAARVGLSRPISLERCPGPRFVVVNVASSDAPLLHIEIVAGPGDALFRVGDTRVNPMVEVPDWSQTFASHRASVDALVAWLGAHPLPRDSTAPPTPIASRPRPPSHPWLPPAALLVFAAFVIAVRPARRDVAIAIAVTVSCLALQVLWGAWGVFHVNGQGALWVSGALRDRRLLDAYGGGYADLFGPLAHTAWLDRGIFAANALAWALTAGLAFGLARRLGLDTVPSALAAGALAIDPVALRFASTESYFPSIVLLGTAATLALVDAAATRRRGRTVLGLAAAVLLLALMVQIHPAAWIPAGLTVVALVALPGASWTRRIAVAAIVGAAALVLAGRAVLLVRAQGAPGLIHPFLALRPPVIVALALGALALVARPGSRRFALPFVAHVAALVLLEEVFARSTVLRLAFDHLFVVIPVIACASLLPDAIGRGVARTRSLVIATALAIGVLVVARPWIHARTTEALEYAWLRAALPTLPGDCTVRYVSRAERRVMFVPDYLPGPTVRALEPGEPLDATAAGCTRYVRTSLCSGREGRPVCDAVISNVALHPIASRRFPAVASYDALGYLDPTVETVIFAVDPPLSHAPPAP